MEFRVAIILGIGLIACACDNRTPAESPEPSQSAPATSGTAGPIVPSETPEAAPHSYVAKGNEPFWSIDAGPDGMNYSSPEHLDGVALQGEYSENDGWHRFTSALEGSPLILEVRQGQCFDDMSGFEFSHRARLTRFDGTWNGCARLASEPQPTE